MLSKNILRFIILLLVQVLVLNHIHFSGYINPYLYVLFILLLPFQTPKWLLLVASFLMGLSVDLFSNTPGMNAAASVFMAYVRPGVIRLLKSGKNYEAGMSPGIRDLGFRWFFSYSLILILAHHFVLFYLEIFRMSEFFTTFFRVVLSTIFTMILVIITQYLFHTGKK